MPSLHVKASEFWKKRFVKLRFFLRILTWFNFKLNDVQFAPNLTESFLTSVLISSRSNQERFQGFSFKPSVAFGENTGNPFYHPDENSTIEITKKKMLIVDFGSQFLDGTTNIGRTLHFGEPTREQKKIYTTILAGLIQLSLHVFPEHDVSGIDILIRSPMWKRKEEYQFAGSGIGSYLSVEEGETFSFKRKQIYNDLVSLSAY